MAEHIERERVGFEFERFFKGQEAVQNDVDSLLCVLPATDVAPVVHGRWILKDSRNPFSWRYCSECKHIVTAAQARIYEDCPVCLARMDGDAF